MNNKLIMVQNINFPSGTKVKYQRGSFYDQFRSDVAIETPSSVDGSLYYGSKLYSARSLGNMAKPYNMSACNCYYRLTNPGDVSYFFYQGKCYYDIILDKNIVSNLTSIGQYATSPSFLTISANTNNISNIIYSTAIKYLNFDIDTSGITTVTTPFPTTIKAIFGVVSVKSFSNISYSTFTGYSKAKLYQITLIDIGTNTNQRTVDCSYWEVWGINTSFLPDSRNSLIDSLITYSFDRAAAGYSACTIKLSAKTKALLTEEEIAQITAKGFTIS